MYKKALLVNENGDEFIGWSTEEFKPATGELIFNTAMTGFVEILSDPSYINQIITFTSSHVGNYGMSKTDFESSEPKIEAAIANSFTYNPSSWRSEKSITDWLNEYNIPFSGGFDVRAITTHLRDVGSDMYAFGTDIDAKDLKALRKSKKKGDVSEQEMPEPELPKVPDVKTEVPAAEKMTPPKAPAGQQRMTPLSLKEQVSAKHNRIFESLVKSVTKK